MKSVASRRFWELFYALPPDVQKLAIKNHGLWGQNPHHPSLRFRRLKGSADRFTVRVGDHYRALGTVTGDTILWVWIGSHTDYDWWADDGKSASAQSAFYGNLLPHPAGNRSVSPDVPRRYNFRTDHSAPSCHTNA